MKNTKNKYLSDCCKAEIIIRGGAPDFIHDKCAVTMWMECSNCGNPCNLFSTKTSNKKLKLSKKERDKILKSEDF